MSAAQVLERLSIPNPISVKCARARLRLGHMLSWGTVTVTVTAFMCLVVYLSATRRGEVDPVHAAKTAMVPIVVIQAVILMLLGTGAVASGVAIERDQGLLDYQRMTPMSPTAKILGYLFGLPIREYFLFGLTVPFLLVAAYVGEMPFGRIAHFYVVFFLSVWLYHMTAMVAGMVSSKPRRAAVLSQGLVILLYLVLPNLKFLGLSVFEFLTIRPVFAGMILSELEQARPGLEQVASEQFEQLGRYAEYQSVRFFDTVLHATTYTIMAQGGLLVSMFATVHRKWRDESMHAFSKLQAILLFALTVTFLVGNLWPIIRDEATLQAFSSRLDSSLSPAVLLEILVFVYMLVIGALALFLIHTITPTRETAIKSARRARKSGRRRVGLDNDGASSLPSALVMVGIAAASYFTLFRIADGSSLYYLGRPSVWIGAQPIVLFAAVIIFVQAARERFTTRTVLVALFLMWMVPFFTCMVLWAARDAWATGAYIALPFPPMAVFLSLGHCFGAMEHMPGTTHEFLPPEIDAHGTIYAVLSTSFYVLLAGLMQIERHTWRKKDVAAALA